MFRDLKIRYFDEPGPENTNYVIEVVKGRVKEGDVKYIVVCSISGKTALKVSEELHGLDVQVICASGTPAWQIHGYKWPLIRGKTRKKLEDMSVKIVERTPSTLSGDTVDYGLARYGWVPASWIVAETLEAVGGYGLKTAVEGVLMATDSGMIPPSSKVISIAGTGSGADTSIVAKSAYSACMFSRHSEKRFQILEILAMPMNKTWHKAIIAGEFNVKETE
jgi:hypothetical protein